MDNKEIIRRLNMVGILDVKDVLDRKAIRIAISKLETHPDNRPNEPLTLEELREMDGRYSE